MEAEWSEFPETCHLLYVPYTVDPCPLQPPVAPQGATGGCNEHPNFNNVLPAAQYPLCWFNLVT